ncbi:hypothetical protein [Bartonella sp. CB175]|uniref:hypothetical protein n=1 Tax=Bartonella sp. CB175 TaxID=3112256 RepID=UPI00300E48CE
MVIVTRKFNFVIRFIEHCVNEANAIITFRGMFLAALVFGGVSVCFLPTEYIFVNLIGQALVVISNLMQNLQEQSA